MNLSQISRLLILDTIHVLYAHSGERRNPESRATANPDSQEQRLLIWDSIGADSIAPAACLP